MLTASASTASTSWRAIKIFSIYRLLLSATFVLIVILQLDNSFLGTAQKNLFQVVALMYLTFSIIGHLATYYQKHFDLQLQSNVLVDIFLLALLMHSSGGVSSGLGMLIAVSTSAATILINRPSALGYPVLASFVVVAEELYSLANGVRSQSALTQTGILTVTFLCTGLMAFYLSRRIRESEKTAEQSIRGLASMEKLNEEIIQYMSTGVIVTDSSQNIQLINRAAWVHLGMPESTQSKKLELIATPLARQLKLWKRKNFYRPKPFKNTATGPNLLPKFSPIGDSKENAIIFLDDTSMLNQQAQNLKLASLGRLTASIAHEIRNPLGALSHAAQLLKESDSLDKANAELVEIVEKNTSRVNGIIENIMQLSTRKTAQVKEMSLNNYLTTLKDEYLIDKPKNYQIDLQLPTQDVLVLFDFTQLRQILTNLFDNGIRYSDLNQGIPSITIMLGVEPQNNTPFLDIVDKGEGIAPDIAEKIFEPFFTTSKTGTGLGLYLSRELCEANRARLDYIPLTAGGSCFRISFSTTKQSLH
ncbi:MAG: ATP-binding protein [Kangiellaceae bacterium]|jgi:two-component system, NtrC family, sensor histidine kinase PilS